jgi:adenosylcobinamide kinase/adenosylcobinamide-phosphate guanylyltransferase
MIILVTGGAASGKSKYAEGRIIDFGTPAIYLATMKPFGDEAAARITKHRKQRQQHRFQTVEIYEDLENAFIPENENILLECMSNLVANEMFPENGEYRLKDFDNILQRILRGVKRIVSMQKNSGKNLVIVTNEVFLDTLDYEIDTIEYIRMLAQVNRYLAKIADEVVEVVYGIPVYIKGGQE